MCIQGQARIDMDVFIARYQLTNELGKNCEITDEQLWEKMIQNGGYLFSNYFFKLYISPFFLLPIFNFSFRPSN